VARYNDSNGKDRRRYDQNGNGLRRPLTSSVGWGQRRELVQHAQSKPQRRRVPDAIYTLRGYKAWAAKVRQNWDTET
jgi:hypothetical protein